MQLSELGLLCLCRWLALGGREGGTHYAHTINPTLATPVQWWQWWWETYWLQPLNPRLLCLEKTPPAAG